MRPTAIIPAICCAAALVLSFLCLFAGSKKGFMEDYHLITLNTSRIGYNVINDASTSGSSTLSNLLNLIPDEITDEVNEIAGDLASRLGVEDFYSLHILDYCFGDYTPGVLPNATLPMNAIHKNLTACSAKTANFHFQPADIIADALNASGTGVTLEDLNWPADIQRGIDALHMLQTAVFVLYCIAIGLIFLSLIAALVALLSAGRLAACLNVMVAALAFLAIGIASGLVTAVMVKGTNVINQYTDQVGVQAYRGGKFLSITWAATGLMLGVLVGWSVETCFGHRRRREAYPKHG